MIKLLEKPELEKLLNTFTAKVYSAMALMLTATGLLSWSSYKLGLTEWLIRNPLAFIVLLVVEFLAVANFTYFREKLSILTNVGLASFYTVLNAITLSVIFPVYTTSSIAVIFASSVAIFIAASIYGFYGKTLGHYGKWIFTALTGLLVAMIGNLLIGSTILNYIISSVAVVVFTILAAYDAQMIKTTGLIEPTNSKVIEMALNVYIDFINIFLNLLQLFGIKTDSRS